MASSDDSGTHRVRALIALDFGRTLEGAALGRELAALRAENGELRDELHRYEQMLQAEIAARRAGEPVPLADRRR